jgi:ribosomal protein L14E/L6E/L27E
LGLPEEVVNYIDNTAVAQIDEHNIIIVTDPAIRAVYRRQPVAIRIIKPIALAKENIV